MNLLSGDNPLIARAEHEAATLAGLRAQYPHLSIVVENYGAGRAWVARGDDGHPWVVLSDDLARFRAALDACQ